MALKSVQVEVLTGPQGGGKSETMRRETIQNGGLYLFALPIQALIDEQSDDFFRDAPGLYTIKVYSEPRKSATAKRLDEARRDIEERGLVNAVIFTTHATLMDHSLSGFEAWNVRVDEAPAAVQAGKFHIGPSQRRWVEETFKLDGEDGYDWSAVSLQVPKPNWQEIERDSGAKPLAEFLKQAAQPARAFVKAKAWGDRDDFEWFSMWSPLSLAHCKSVQIAGSGYTNSIGFQTAKAVYADAFGIEMREISSPRTAQPNIEIHYFTRNHDGTTDFWKSHDGLKTLVPVVDFLSKALPENGFWSGNEIIETVMMGRTEAEFVPPLAAGLNKYREARACSIIFSAKARNEDRPLMDVFELTKADIERAREGEAIIQFAMRGAIRNVDFGGKYDIYVYSEKQANLLCAHLIDIGFTKVQINPVDQAGVMEVTRDKEEPAVKLTPEEKAAKAAADRQKDTDRKRETREAKRIAEGRPKRGRGRPNKSN